MTLALESINKNCCRTSFTYTLLLHLVELLLSQIGFFAASNIEVSHGANGVLLVKFFDGKFTGDAFVLFKDDAVSNNTFN